VRKKMRLVARGCLTGIVLAAALWPNAYAGAQEATKIRALLPIPNFDESFAPVAVAQEMGYFKEEGLDVTIIPVNGSKEVAIQVSAGNADVGLASPADAVIGMQSGTNLDVQYYSNLYYQNIWPLSVVEDSPIKSVKDLKGKKIGVLSIGSTGITFGRAYVKEAGFNPQSDVTFVPIGAGGQALTAIRQGVVDALVFNDAALAKFSVLVSRLGVCRSATNCGSARYQHSRAAGNIEKKAGTTCRFARPLPKVICLPSPTRRQRQADVKIRPEASLRT